MPAPSTGHRVPERKQGLPGHRSDGHFTAGRETVVSPGSVSPKPSSALAALLLLASPGLHAAAKKPKDASESGALGTAVRPKVREIERGLWFSMEAAPIAHIEWQSRLPPNKLPRQLLPDDYGLGARMGGRVGYDFFKLVSVDGYAVGQFREKRIRRGRSYTGDISDLNAGVGLRLMPITIKDRLSFTGRVAFGFAFLMPGEVARDYTNPGCIPPQSSEPITDFNPACVALPGIPLPASPLGWQPFPAHVIFVTPSTEAMLGIEYFTHLRHFSVGVDVMAGLTPWPLQLHAGVVPYVKYSFGGPI